MTYSAEDALTPARLTDKQRQLLLLRIRSRISYLRNHKYNDKIPRWQDTMLAIKNGALTIENYEHIKQALYLNDNLSYIPKTKKT